MKVVAVAHYSIPQNRGGSELMLHELLAALVRAGHTVELIVTDQTGPTLTVDGVRIRQGVEHLSRLDGRHDVAIGHHKNTGAVLDWGERYRRPVVQVVHNNNPATRQHLARGADLVVFNTEWLRRGLGYRGRSLVVNPPVWGHEHATTRGDMVTLVNPIREKGADTFYRLAARMPGVRFLAVEGGYLRERQIRRELPNVVWQPHTQNMARDVWARTRILLMPSSYESWGMVGVEAMHSGIPVIAHPTPGLRESLAYAGVFLHRSSTPEWAAMIRRLWDSDEASERARKRAAELDPAPQLERWVRAVEEL